MCQVTNFLGQCMWCLPPLKNIRQEVDGVVICRKDETMPKQFFGCFADLNCAFLFILNTAKECMSKKKEKVDEELQENLLEMFVANLLEIVFRNDPIQLTNEEWMNLQERLANCLKIPMEEQSQLRLKGGQLGIDHYISKYRDNPAYSAFELDFKFLPLLCYAQTIFTAEEEKKKKANAKKRKSGNIILCTGCGKYINEICREIEILEEGEIPQPKKKRRRTSKKNKPPPEDLESEVRGLLFD